MSSVAQPSPWVVEQQLGLGEASTSESAVVMHQVQCAFVRRLRQLLVLLVRSILVPGHHQMAIRGRFVYDQVMVMVQQVVASPQALGLRTAVLAAMR